MTFEVNEYSERLNESTYDGPLPDMTVSKPPETEPQVSEPAVVLPADIPAMAVDGLAQATAQDPSLTDTNVDTDADGPSPTEGDVEHVALDSGVEASEERTKPAYADLEASVAEMEERFTAEKEALEQAEESVSAAERQAIGAVRRQYVDARREAEQRGDKVPSFAAMLASAEGVPENFKERMSAFEATEAALDVADKELDQYLPQKLADVTHMVTELEKNLDYDKVVETAFAGDPEVESEGNQRSVLYEVSRLVRTRGLLDSGEPVPYRELRIMGNKMAEYQQKWQQNGLLAERDTVPAPEPAETLTVEQLGTMKTDIQGAIDIQEKYKRGDSSARDKAQPVLDVIGEMEKFRPLPTKFSEIYASSAWVCNDALGSVLHRRLEQKRAELPWEAFEADVHSDAYRRFVERARAIDPIEALERLEVKGTFENLPFAFSEEEFKTFLGATIPAIALASTKRVTFRPLTEQEQADGEFLGRHIWSEELGGSEIIISDSGLRERYQFALEALGSEDEEAQATAQYFAKDEMLETSTHEFAHVLHRLLPYAALKRWEGKRASDTTKITPYVKRCHDQKRPSRYREDFADSMGQFGHRPHVLTITSSARFAAMKEIYEEYMPYYQDTLKPRQEELIVRDRRLRLAQGMSEVELRRIYLAHHYDVV